MADREWRMEGKLALLCIAKDMYKGEGQMNQTRRKAHKERTGR
jgi:hypothetical protein